MDYAIGHLASLCDNILEPVRTRYDMPFTSSSAYCAGLAVDIEVPGVSNPDLAWWVADNQVCYQLILECWTGEPGSGWRHIGNDLLEPRRQVLTYSRGKGYMNGLPE